VFIAANAIGLACYTLYPAAPPRMLGSLGFVDTLNETAVNHHSGLIASLANPYAAMPSLHAADALIVGVVLAGVCKNWFGKIAWALWPGWVWFSVMATGNHFWLDVLAGIVVAIVSLAIVYRREWRRWIYARPAAA
jgi:membrane-associated phospholipid phosphatase